MKTKYAPLAHYLIFAALLTLSSCKSFLEVDVPRSQLVRSTVFDNYETATIAMTDIYAKIRDKGILSGTRGSSNLIGCYADELTSYRTQTDPNFYFYNNSLLPSNTFVSEYWSFAYNQIFAANSVIEGAQASTNLSADQKNELLGEALFVRALSHFYLVNLFGDIPYISQTDYKINIVVTRTPTADVYKLLIADLKKSIELLPVNYIAPNKIIPNQAVAKALLSRVYLYQKSWPEAESMATTLIDEKTLFTFEDNISNVFLIGSKETIWQLNASVAGRNTDEGAVFIFTSGPPPSVALSTGLVNSFSDTDLRKANWIKAVTSGTSTWYHPNKYKERLSTTTSKEYSIVFRLSEQYLIRAEARAQQNNLEGAKKDLNKIRFRADIGDTPANTKAELLRAILQERSWELFTEHGHRFFDLKRNNQLDQALSGIKPGWNSSDLHLPIPEKELSTNPNLRPQNTGY
ncbi:SusD family protein [compost metagenome]